MNRVILNEEDPQTKRTGDQFILQDPEVRAHLLGHIKVKVGDTLKVILLNEALAQATVEKIEEESLHLKVFNKIEVKAPKTRLIIGASRPPTVKKILEHGAAFGVEEFVFFQAALSEKSYLTSKIFDEDKTYELLTKGLAQGAQSYHLPKVSRVNNLDEAIHLANSQKFLLSLRGEETFINVELDLSEGLTLAIGPERGWTKNEESLLLSSGFKSVQIASSVLRVEMAAFSALAQLAMLELNR